MTLSPSVPPTVCLNPSLSLSVYLSPSSMQHQSFSSGNELFSLLSVSLSHSSSQLAITAYLLSLSLSPPLSLYLAGYIRSSVCCLGLWQPVSYPKWFWHAHACECALTHLASMCVCWCLFCVCPCPVRLILLMNWKQSNEVPRVSVNWISQWEQTPFSLCCLEFKSIITQWNKFLFVPVFLFAFTHTTLEV